MIQSIVLQTIMVEGLKMMLVLLIVCVDRILDIKL